MLNTTYDDVDKLRVNLSIETKFRRTKPRRDQIPKTPTSPTPLWYTIASTRHSHKINSRLPPLLRRPPPPTKTLIHLPSHLIEDAPLHRRRLTHPAVQMAVSRKRQATVTLLAKAHAQLFVVAQRAVRRVHGVLGAVEELDGQAPQPLQAVVVEQLAAVAIDEAAAQAHAHQVVQARHAGAAEDAVELVVGGAVEPVVAPQPAEGELAAVAGHAAAELVAAGRVEAQRLVEERLDVGVGFLARAVEPVAAGHGFVDPGEADRERGLVPVDVGEFGVHEDVGGGDAADPVPRDGAVEKAHGERYGAGAVADDVDFVWCRSQFASDRVECCGNV